MSEHPVVVAVTGASGVVYGQRLLEVLLQSNVEVHLTISESARVVAEHELGLEIDLKNFEVRQLLPSCSLPSEATSKFNLSPLQRFHDTDCQWFL